MGSWIAARLIARRGGLLREAIWTAVLFLAGGAVSGYVYFVSPGAEVRQGSSMTPGEFVPSLMLVSGRGFVVAEDYHAPEIAPFLSREINRFDPASLPADFAVLEPGVWDQRHRYLYYAAAGIWLVFGVSWTALKLLPILLFASTTAVLFRILRLAGRPLFAAPATLMFMLQPAVIDLHLTVRDFSKAPFFLGAILAMGCLLQGRHSAPRLLALAGAAGLAAGLGSGFRHDLVMALPPALLAILLGPRVSARPVWLAKGAAAAVLVAAFFAAGWPIHRSYDGLGAAHDTIMGFSRPVDYGLGILQADYQHIALQSDHQIHALQVIEASGGAGSGAAREVSAAEIEAAGMRLVRWLLMTYPADVVTRAIASIMWALSGGMVADTAPAPWRLLLGIAMPAAVLCVISAGSPRRGLVVAAVCAPLFAYISIQFGWRHGFHLSFIPWWCGLFLLERCAHWLWHWRRRIRGRGTLLVPAPFNRGAPRNAAFVLGAVAAALIVPLLVTRPIQARNVERLTAAYLDADREALRTLPRPVGDSWTLFAVDTAISEPDTPYFEHIWPFRGSYLAAAFAPGVETVYGAMKYEADEGIFDLSFTFRIPAAREGVLYFFPVFESWHLDAGPWSRFAGVALPNEHARQFRGLYRLTDPGTFTFWSLYTLRKDGAAFNGARRLMLTGDSWLAREMGPPPIPTYHWDAWRAHAWGETAEVRAAARASVEAMRAADPQDVGVLVWHGTLLEMEGDYDSAEEAYRTIIDLVPRHFVGFKRMEHLEAQRGATTQERFVRWAALAEEYPDSQHAFWGYARALRDKGEMAAAVNAARRALALAPWRRDAYGQLFRLIEAAGPEVDALAIWRETAEASPDEAAGWLYLGVTARRHDDLALAREALARATALDPYTAWAHLEYGYTLLEVAAPVEAAAAFERFAERGGDPGQAHLGLALAHAAAGDTEAARTHAVKAQRGGAALPRQIEALLE